MADKKDPTAAELRDDLRKRDLPTTGTKDELAARVDADDADGEPATGPGGVTLADLAPHVTPPQGSLEAYGMADGTYVAEDFLVRPGEAVAAYNAGDEVPAEEIDKYGWHSKVRRTDKG
jgi:hypothetical protein